MHKESSHKLPSHNPSLVVPTDGYYDPDTSNGLRAQSARNAVRFYYEQRGFDSDETTAAVDLIADILHYLHSLGEDPVEKIRKAKEYFVSEAI